MRIWELVGSPRFDALALIGPAVARVLEHDMPAERRCAAEEDEWDEKLERSLRRPPEEPREE